MQRKIAKGLAVGALTLTVGLTSFGAVASAKSTQALAHSKATTRTQVKTANQKAVAAKAAAQTKRAAAQAKAAAAKTKAKAHQRTIPGRVTSVGSSSLTMTSGNKTYTVSISSASIVDRNRKAISLGSINVGERINVAGLVTGLSVSAQVVRDITLPKATSATN